MATNDDSQATTINREIGAWIRMLRKQWMAPIGKVPEEDEVNWKFWRRFLYAFVGSFTFAAGLLLFRLLDFGLPFLGDPMVASGQIVIFLIMVPYIVWFAWLVSWRDFGYGPVRLFLSAILLPALVVAVIERVVVP